MRSFVVCGARGVRAPPIGYVPLCFGDVRLYVFSFAAVGLSPIGCGDSAHCSWGLTTLLGEVAVQFILLLVLFDRTKGRVRGGIAGQLT